MGTIEAKRLPIESNGVGGGHLYLEFYDDKGERIGQANGLAYDPDTGKFEEAPVSGDYLLKIYTDASDNFILEGSGTDKNSNTHEGVVIFRGSEGEVRSAFDSVEMLRERVNAAHLDYHFSGNGYSPEGTPYYNSNSAFSAMIETLREPLNLDAETIEEAKDLGTGFLSRNPGVNRDILRALSEEDTQSRLQIHNGLPPDLQPAIPTGKPSHGMSAAEIAEVERSPNYIAGAIAFEREQAGHHELLDIERENRDEILLDPDTDPRIIDLYEQKFPDQMQALRNAELERLRELAEQRQLEMERLEWQRQQEKPLHSTQSGVSMGNN